MKRNHNEQYIIGIDEAGRGPCIGPLVFSVIGMRKSKLNILTCLGVKDSKLLTAKKREDLVPEIIKLADYQQTVSISVEEINLLPLTTLCIKKIAFLLDATFDYLHCVNYQIFIDQLGGLRRKKFLLQLCYYLKSISHQTDFGNHIIYEKKADLNYPIVAAASILAKVQRDQGIKKIQESCSLELGSGYVTKKTNRFLKEYWVTYGKLPPYVRHKWRNVRQIIDETYQQKELVLTNKKQGD